METLWRSCILVLAEVQMLVPNYSTNTMALYQRVTRLMYAGMDMDGWTAGDIASIVPAAMDVGSALCLIELAHV